MRYSTLSFDNNALGKTFQPEAQKEPKGSKTQKGNTWTYSEKHELLKAVETNNERYERIHWDKVAQAVPTRTK